MRVCCVHHNYDLFTCCCCCCDSLSIKNNGDIVEFSGYYTGPNIRRILQGR